VGFHWTTWLSVLSVTIISSMVFRFILTKENNPNVIVKHLSDDVDENLNLQDTIFMHFGCLMQQGAMQGYIFRLLKPLCKE